MTRRLNKVLHVHSPPNSPQVVQIVVEVLRMDYPAGWPSFFHDLVATLGQGPAMVDIFDRVLFQVTTIDSNKQSNKHQ